ncbi:WD40/YVTN/BNR-like repeat-containing protein, partial [Bacteroidota bacterium]
NHQRSVSYGDGIYKSMNGGKTWKNMGLKNSRHIGMIAIDPRNSQVVYVAAEGSLWAPGGDRGLYKTENGGTSWERILFVSEQTGINNVVLHPDNPDIVFATSEQRRRHVYTKIGGGPETNLYKSYDAGKTWKKITKGLPSVHKGGMGIAISPANTDVIYLIIEAALDENNKKRGGFFRSKDQGETWEKMSSHTESGQYYNEIYCDPNDVDKVYSVETRTFYTEDGGKTFKELGRKFKHVDDHAMWIDPENSDHFFIGSDGGLYETFDGGRNYDFKENLPITQFYRVTVDNDEPFYNVYGGTQDNNTLGGPSRTTSSQGISNEDWFVTLGGDGFWTAIDPVDPNLVYCEYQYGNVYRFDKKSGELQYIKPMPEKGELTFRWNWNAPLIMSPHSNTRLYIAANKVFRSDDRGESWEAISGDLTTQTDRNTWPVMEHYWSIDAVKKDVSTSLYNTIVSMDESPVKENLLYIGTDDGLIQVTEDDENWRKTGNFPGVPDYTYVSDIKASMHNENVVFATFDNRKRDDFKPYVLKSEDKGMTWKSISSNLPDDHPVHTIEQDHLMPGLLFVGTEFEVFFSINSGQSWNRLKNGLPTISVKDIAIQRRENDLVLGTFGRSFYILDNYSPLRELDNAFFEKEAHLFPVKDALMYIQTREKRGNQGSTFYTAENPPFGAIFTYYLRDSLKTRRQQRHETEKELFNKKQKIPQPDREEIRKENIEDQPYVLFTISNANGDIVRRIKASARKGIHRFAWDLRYPYIKKISLDNEIQEADKMYHSGFLAMPGKYAVKMELVHDARIEILIENVDFEAKTLNNRTLPANDLAALDKFQQEISTMAINVYEIFEYSDELVKKLKYLKKAAYEAKSDNLKLLEKVYTIEKELDEQIFKLKGTIPEASKEEVPPEPPSISLRLDNIMRRQWYSTSAPTQTEIRSLEILREELPLIKNDLKQIGEVKIREIEQALDALNSPWTPGRELN